MILVGIPAALLTLSPVHLPSRLPNWDEFTGVWTRPDDGTAVWGILTVAAWACWLVFTAQVVASLVAQVRRVEVPVVHGIAWLQRGASSLVAAAVLMLTTPSAGMSAGGAASSAAAAEVRPTSPPAAPKAVSPRPPRVADSAVALQRSSASTSSADDPGPDVVDVHPTVVVEPNDTLWDLAERHLGSGPRYVEIAALNRGVQQADGRALTDAHWIYPGWVLRLPMDAANVPPARSGANTAQAPSDGGVYVVAPGDTLWGIAEMLLGDGARFGEIVRLNVGVRQPDGTALTDPDLIRPGWRLTLPREVRPAEPTEPAGASPAPATNAEPTPDPLPVPVATATQPPETGAEGPAAAAPRHLADSEPETPAPSSGASTNDSDLSDDDLELEAEPRPIAGLVLGMTGLGAALVIGELARRRARQRRLRRTGERVPLPAPGSGAATAEAELRRAVPMLTLDQIDLAMRRIAIGSRAQDRDLPRIQAVLVGADGVELLLADDDPDPVPPFTLVAPRRWAAANSAVLDGENWPGENPYPNLVSVGLHGTRTVLLNLEAAGTLSIVGDPAMCVAALRGIACELACRAFDVRLAPHVTAELGELLDNDNPEILSVTVPDSAFYESQLTGYFAHFREHGLRDVLDARRDPDRAEGWLTAVHLGSPVPDLDAAPWSGLAVVAVGEHGGWRLVVDPDGAGRLDPLGLDLAVAHLDESAWSGLMDSLHAAREEPPRRPALKDQPTASEELAVVRESLGPAPEPVLGDLDVLDFGPLSQDGPEEDARAPRVLMLGRPAVVFDSATAKPQRERRLTEIVAFLALNPGASTEALDALLGRGKRVSNANRNAYISRARAWLGQAPDGEPYLPLLTARDDYRLHPAVRTDWDDFRELLRAGVDAEADGAPALRAALDLVRGRPFADAAVGTYDWAEPVIHQMIDQIVDAAHLYAAIAGDGEYRSVQEALAIALGVDPCNELLYRDAIEAAHRVGDSGEVDRLIKRLEQLIREIDPEDGLEPETEQLVRRVRSYSRGRAP
ncbi:MAG: LysM peptidoglycan-binding domain-containing protein [Actinomycetales bacterium]|nr:LysM peptidoglycan-binding domain-containing protein [Actinomycetales bacterium]